MSNNTIRKRKGSARDIKKGDDGASEITTGHRGSLINTVQQKWEKIINEERRDISILQIREEIFESLFKICYEKYLQRQAIEFTVHCAHQAFLKVASVYFIKIDPGEKLGKNNLSWTPDTEPEASPMDAWLSHTLPVVQRQPTEERETPSSTQLTPVTEEMATSTASTHKSAVQEEPGGLDQLLYTRYQPSTEWTPAAVESALQHSTEPLKPKTDAESPPQEPTGPSLRERSAARSRKTKVPAAPAQTQAGVSNSRARLPSIKPKSEEKMIGAQKESPAAMGIPRPPVLPLSALPPSRAEVKCIVLPLKDDSEVSEKKYTSKKPAPVKQKPSSVRWSKSTKSFMM